MKNHSILSKMSVGDYADFLKRKHESNVDPERMSIVTATLQDFVSTQNIIFLHS